MNLFSLEGQTAVVTGASRGIGLAIAKTLAEAGANIVAVATRLQGPETLVAQAVSGAGVRFESRAVDLSDRGSVRALIDSLAETPVDILINNGGTIRRAPAVDHSDEDFDYVMEVNLRAAWILSRELGRRMVQSGSGKIVNTASMLSFQGGINVPGYTASKHAIAGLTKELANEWAAYGVNVNAVAPGYIATDNTAALRADSTRSAEILSRIPAGRWGEPSDIGGAVLFLCSPAARYVNGVVLPVDGGWLGR
ncbi:SDR family oxidoreductase [Actinomyces sp. F1_1611]